MPQLMNLSDEDLDAEANLAGYACYDAAGNKLGTVDSVIADAERLELRYLVVATGGWFRQRQFVVPAGDVREVDDARRQVSFATLTKQTLESGRYPTYDERWWAANDRASFDAYARDVDRAYHPDRPTEAAVDYADDLYHRPAAGAQRLELLEERLKVNTERYQAGAVTLGKRLTERTETVEVPVREEQVIIERRPGSGEVTAAELSEAEVIDVPVMRERVQVAKETIVREEVTVRTEATEHQEQIRETLRTEELVVEDPAGLVGEEPAASPLAPADEAEHRRRA